ncbi:hypothetical protein DAPPUDRAFT_54305, partial [Daphnia pulex]
KLGLLRLRGSTSIPAADGGFGYLQDWVWWTGLITMGIGEASNFAAYAFAPAALVTPLGALSILVSAVLAPKFLNEKLNILGKIGCMLCILGSSIIVIHAPKEDDKKTGNLETLNQVMKSKSCLALQGTSMIGIKFLQFHRASLWEKNVAVYIFICSSIGSLSVICCKGLSLCIRESMSSQERSVLNKQFFLFLIPLVICIVVQMNYLNKALDSFSSNLVNPVLYIFFTSFVILASSILFQEL